VRQEGTAPTETLIGIDGCPGGWLAVFVQERSRLRAQVFPNFGDLLNAVPPGSVIGVDIPIGLPNTGPRPCDLEARQRLKMPRSASVFPAPLRACLGATSYKEAAKIRYKIEGKKMSLQAFGILKKVAEVDALLLNDKRLAERVVEVHPEVSFMEWNSKRPMKHSKHKQEGKAERAKLIEKEWPNAIESLRIDLRGENYALDDLYDSLSALWSMGRWVNDEHEELGSSTFDSRGLPMRIVA
jgi:predicted RNase H-like nuclease